MFWKTTKADNESQDIYVQLGVREKWQAKAAVGAKHGSKNILCETIRTVQTSRENLKKTKTQLNRKIGLDPIGGGTLIERFASKIPRHCSFHVGPALNAQVQ